MLLRKRGFQCRNLTAQTRPCTRVGLLRGASQFRGAASDAREENFEACRLFAESGDNLALGCYARRQLLALPGRLFALGGNLLCPREDLLHALAVKQNAILGAIDFERRLPDEVVMLPEFAVEFERAPVEQFLLGFMFAHRFGSAGFVGGDAVNELSQPVGLRVQFARTLLASTWRNKPRILLRAIPRSAGPSMPGASRESELFFDLHINVVHAGKIHLRGFELGFRQALLGLELGNAGSLFDDGPPVGGLRAKHLPDPPLLDDRVGVRAQANAHKQLLNVAQLWRSDR